MAIEIVEEKSSWGKAVTRVDASKLEAGDRVATVDYGTYDGPNTTIYKVSRRTATQVVCVAEGNGHEARFYRATGRPVGKSFAGALLALNHHEVCNALQNSVIRNLFANLHAEMRQRERLNAWPKGFQERMELLRGFADRVQAATDELGQIRAESE